ncbi:hypothetical protein Lal_00039180 [Lupinus albus]|nr:hypothetical protein Lal_00039180 [Lupinus albus]
MDKEWIKLPRYSSEYIDGVEFFLNYAYTNGKPQGGEILCPCAKCHNTCWEVRAVVYDHLIGYGFQKGYDVWVRHGEVLKDMDLDGCMDDDNDSVDDIEGLLRDTFRDAAEDNELNNGLNDDAKNFYNLIEEAQQELYPGCKNFSTLSFTIRLYLLKCLHGWSNASFSSLMGLLREAMPHLNISDSFYKTRGMIRDLGLDEEEINFLSCHTRSTSMLLDDFLNNNVEHEDEQEGEDEHEGEDVQEGEEGEENDDVCEVREDINHQNEQDDETSNSTNQGNVNGQHQKESVAKQNVWKIEILFNEFGVPIGPDQRIVIQFSNFLGTIARSSDFCPLVYTNWKVVPDKDLIWTYVKQKYIIPDVGKKAVFAILNDAWRRHKCVIKEEHFSKYKITYERLKNRPKDISKSHFKELIRYWSLGNIKEMSEQNSKNKSHKKWRHRTGSINFGVIRERLRATKENKEMPNQAEMFFETRQSKKGESLDQETTNAMAQLQDLIENCSEQLDEAFQNVFGKEKPGRVRCHGRVTTPTLLKRTEEITKIENKHADEMKLLNDIVLEMEAKHKQEMSSIEQKFQILLKMS